MTTNQALNGRASPEAGGSIQRKRRTERKSFTTFTRETQPEQENKNEQRERQHSFEIPPPLFSSLISAASSSRQPSPPQQGGIRAAVPVPFRPLSSRGKTLLKSLPLHFSWEFLMVFWVKSWVFREGGWGGALRISETTLPERFECGKVDGSEGV